MSTSRRPACEARRRRPERVLDGLPGPVYVHIDLDVLEPSVFGSTCYPEPDGVQPQRLIDGLPGGQHLGAAITEHAPAGDHTDAGEAKVIRQLGAALAGLTATPAPLRP